MGLVPDPPTHNLAALTGLLGIRMTQLEGQGLALACFVAVIVAVGLPFLAICEQQRL